MVTVGFGVNAALDSLTIRNGTNGIANHGTVTVIASIISHNSTLIGGIPEGGGIINYGSLESGNGFVIMRNSRVSRNSVIGADGGGIANLGGNIMIDGSSVSKNTSLEDGGGIFNETGSIPRSTTRQSRGTLLPARAVQAETEPAFITWRALRSRSTTLRYGTTPPTPMAEALPMMLG